MSESSVEILETLHKICGLLELLAEDKISQRDAKQRAVLREIVGTSAAKQKAVFLMDGNRTQVEIHRAAPVHQGNLSTMVSRLEREKLLVSGDTKRPKLNFSIPSHFFENNAEGK